MPDAVNEAAEDSESRFQNGRLGMFLNSRRGVPAYREITAFDWDVAPLPRGKQRAGILHADAFCMAAATKEKVATWAFIEYAMSAAGQSILAKSGRTVPSMKSVANSPVFLDPEARPRAARVSRRHCSHAGSTCHGNLGRYREPVGKELERSLGRSTGGRGRRGGDAAERILRAIAGLDDGRPVLWQPAMTSASIFRRPPRSRGYLPNDRAVARRLNARGLAQALSCAGVPRSSAAMRMRRSGTGFITRRTILRRDDDNSKEMRQRLDEEFAMASEVMTEQVSTDGTANCSFALPDERGQRHEVEMVYIRKKTAGNLVHFEPGGLHSPCSFCHTGTQKLVRNMTANEIVSQVMIAATASRMAAADRSQSHSARAPLHHNVVLMGMANRSTISTMSKMAMEIVADGEGCHCRSGASRSPPPGGAGNSPGRSRDRPMLAISCMAHRRNPQQAGALNKNIPSRNYLRPAAPIGPVQRAAHHLRICDAQRRQRHAPDATPGETARGIPAKSISSPSIPGPARNIVFRLGDDEAFAESSQGGLRLPGAHAARPRHHGRLRQLKSESQKIRARERVAGDLQSATVPIF